MLQVHKKIAARTVVFPKGHGTMQATGEAAPPLLEYMCLNRFSGVKALEP